MTQCCTSCGASLAPRKRFCAACDAATVAASGVWERLGSGGILLIIAALLMIVSVSTPWFTTIDGIDSLRFNEGFVMVSPYQGYQPPSPIGADVGYFAAILGAVSAVIGVLAIFAAHDSDGTVYATGIYLFLLAAILLTAGSLIAGARLAGSSVQSTVRE